MRYRLPGAALALVLLCAAGVAPTAAKEDRGGAKGGIDKKTAAAIDAAIAKGRASLRAELPREAASAAMTYNHGDRKYPLAIGRLAFISLALLESGCPPADPELQRAWSRLRAEPPKATYDAGVSLMFAEAYLRSLNKGRRAPVKDPAVRAWMQKTADYLASGCYGGVWTYDCPGGTLGYPVAEDPKAPYRVGGVGEEETEPVEGGLDKVMAEMCAKNPYGGDHDHSNTQYAVLGLKAASLCGVKVKNARLLWRTVIQHFLQAQEASGPEVDLQLTREESKFKVTDYSTEAGPSRPRARGWAYSAAPTRNEIMASYGTMTAAGMTALIVAKSEVPDLNAHESTRCAVAVRDALAWLQVHWSVEENPLGKSGMVYSPRAHYYHLYGLERVGVLTGVRALAGHPWYAEGAAVMMRQQKPDGSWGEATDRAPEDFRVKTAFALLFLVRSTHEEYAVGEEKE